ncbi:hypothetical protein HZF24_06900 [Sedimentibacter hydroxybenzoicus DSM 7310]|uniref:Transglycosylase n=1 Tax=Sedimentibacter hydroxybenzoicus DSM 7310 TaxID=1123245 RepID=A0A974GW18_SEDHY|nr:hypothetical protein [Sedimentibacter hydroxybenzoicus]NYB73866.1 hypothetical protein [Sedimentibacter hydroxybenzoicus DSM 7310]
MLAVCDGNNGCNQEFNLEKLEIEQLDDGIEKTYFKCPNCGKEFIAFYTDEAIRNKQKKIRKLKDANKIERLKKHTAIDMNVLRKRIEQEVI